LLPFDLIFSPNFFSFWLTMQAFNGHPFEGLTQPNQPTELSGDLLPIRMYGNTKRTFQCNWLSLYPWLHLDCQRGKVLCFVCGKFHLQGGFKNMQPELAFVTEGFNGWKDAVESFKKHEKSSTHLKAVQSQSKSSIAVQLSTQHAKDQEHNRDALLHIIRALKYLARQGLAFRGDEEWDGLCQIFLILSF